MIKQIDKTTGFIFKTTNNKVIIEMPINNLIRGMESDPANCLEGEPRATIDKGMKREFIEWIAANLQDDTDEDDSETFITKMLSSLFTRIYEGFEVFVVYHDEDDEKEG